MDITVTYDGGHYDETGRWIVDKYCFIDCGNRCDCKPPNDVWQLPPNFADMLNKPPSTKGPTK